MCIIYNEKTKIYIACNVDNLDTGFYKTWFDK